jgi:ketosteroid isomerase-like protein
MRKIFFAVAITALLFACSDKKEKTEATTTGDQKEKTAPANLPYTAQYSDLTQDVSDADLKSVLESYKAWENGDMSKTAPYYSDSIWWEHNNGEKKLMANADLMKTWGSFRDSLSSVVVVMSAWDKAYSPATKESFVLTWYKEYDTYKGGKVDSAEYHDINMVKDGKISMFSQYKRALK